MQDDHRYGWQKVISFRFTKEHKKKEGLNSIFTDFIICRLTETTISKSRDVWRQSGESMQLLSWIRCSVLHVIDTKQLLMCCRKVQQFTGSKKYHCCTLSRETDRQRKGNGLNLCSSNTGADFAQLARRAPFCVVTILSSANSWILWNTLWGLH